MAVFAAMKPALLSLLAALLTGCVTIPVPPFGESRGALGDLKVSVTVQYFPKTNPLQSTTATDHALKKLIESTSTRTLKDK
jgi:starvation-inducible outer membrane lipoprotein